MTASTNVYSPRREEARRTNLTLRMSEGELQEIEALAKRYGEAKGTPPPGKTALIRMGLKRLMRSYPAPKQA
jgi:hypothetical protein